MLLFTPQMFALLLNFDPTVAPAHSTYCAAVDGTHCITENTSFRQEASMIGDTAKFEDNLFASHMVRHLCFPCSCSSL